MLPLAMADKCGLVSEILIAIGTDGPQAEAGEGGKSVYGVWELAMNVGLLLPVDVCLQIGRLGKAEFAVRALFFIPADRIVSH